MKRKDKSILTRTITLKQAALMTVCINVCFVTTLYGKSAYTSIVQLLNQPRIVSNKNLGAVGPYSDSLESNFKTISSRSSYCKDSTKKLTKKF